MAERNTGLERGLNPQSAQLVLKCPVALATCGRYILGEFRHQNVHLHGEVTKDDNTSDVPAFTPLDNRHTRLEQRPNPEFAAFLLCTLQRKLLEADQSSLQSKFCSLHHSRSTNTKSSFRPAFVQHHLLEASHESYSRTHLKAHLRRYGSITT
jgi:hypothetical protein